MEEFKNRQCQVPSDMIPSFLLKTYEILENSKYIDIIGWTKNGEGFIVKKIKEFSEQVLPIHFRHSNYTSFVRQLNMYDFHKTRQENQQNAFKNIMFRKGCKHLLKDIQRKDYKKNRQNGKQDKPIQTKKIDSICDSQYVSKLTHSAMQLETKVIALANLQRIPTTEFQIIKLLDSLFEIKKLNQKFYECYCQYHQDMKQVLIKRKVESQELKIQEDMDNLKKQEQNNTGTHNTLVSVQYLN